MTQAPFADTGVAPCAGTQPSLSIGALNDSPSLRRISRQIRDSAFQNRNDCDEPVKGLTGKFQPSQPSAGKQLSRGGWRRSNLGKMFFDSAVYRRGWS
jgi:hypothetical protein